jgi:hypothetical protein
MKIRENHIGIATPKSMLSRPIDHRGFPVPWFVTKKTDDGKWDFVNIEHKRMVEALKKQVCWVSGQPLGVNKAFCVGPMCVINRTAGDPPVKLEIALWSVQVCPFMSRPLARRTGKHEKETTDNAGIDGVAILRNPGVTAIYVSRDSKYECGRGFNMGAPVSVSWWCQGREATRQEAQSSIDSGIHHLWKLAKDQGLQAEIELQKYIDRAQKLLQQ